MLPDGFALRRYLDGPGLFLDGRPIAYAGLACEGGAWRLCLNPTGLPHYRFFATEATCVRYMEAWAVKWQDDIRAIQPSTGFAHLSYKSDPSAAQAAATADHARRRGRRRRSF